MSTDTNKKQLMEIIKAVGAILGVPLGLFAVVNSIASQPIIALAVAVITAFLMSILVVVFQWAGIQQVIIAWLSLTVIVLASFVVWPNTMTVEGIIRDTAGNPVANTDVLFYDRSNGKYETKTDQDGFYQFKDVPTGEYRVRVGNNEVEGQTKGILVQVVQQNLTMPDQITQGPAPLVSPTITPLSTPDTEPPPDPPTSTPSPTSKADPPPDPPTSTVTPTNRISPTPRAESPTATPTSPSPVSTSDENSYLARAFAGEFSRTVVTALGPFSGQDTINFNKTMADFEQRTGIDIQYEESTFNDLGMEVSNRVVANNAPDIADFPQPGLLGNFARSGDVVDVGTFLNMDKLQANYNQSWLDMATMEGPNGPVLAGVWERANTKSVVWYPKDDFEAAGYEIPETWDELMTLTEQITQDQGTPWCIGNESGAATGWPATDWIEDILLRTTSLENYDKWTRGELTFNSPEVRRAFELMSDIWLNDAYVYGGRASINSTFFGDAPAGMFDNPPKCWLHKQGTFIVSFFPNGRVAGRDYDFFYLPPIDEAYGKPVLIAGDLWAMFNDRPEVRAVIEFFTTGEHLKPWIEAGGVISPHRDSKLEWYPNYVDRGAAEIVLNADSVRFDGSDLMPGEVGFHSFWLGMIDYVDGTKDLETALNEIDASWPR